MILRSHFILGLHLAWERKWLMLVYCCRTNSKSKGVYYPFIEKLVSALEQRENVVKNYEQIKEEARLNMRKLRGKGNEEESEDEF